MRSTASAARWEDSSIGLEEVIMRVTSRSVSLAIAVLALVVTPGNLGLSEGKITPSANIAEGPAILWRAPVDLATRDLYYGPGGKPHEPRSTLTFISEDASGACSKFEAVDQEGVHWKVKLGIEARPETAVSRLLWAAGYFANEDYYLPEVRVDKLPHLHRGSQYVTSGAIVHDARLKRHLHDEKKIGAWAWGHNPFTGTREWNGLRALMALVNNWDLKDVNNAVYQKTGADPEQHYLVSDLGASLGTTGLNRALKGDLRSYEESKWINSVTGDRVDFNVPSPPPAGYFLVLPILVQRLDLVWIGRGIPRADARWLGEQLARLSPAQIRDAFRGAGYSSDQVERFSRVIERRIRELEGL
jgi:hypothetical protein